MFDVGADKYDRFMGRYAMPLAPKFADFAGVEAGQRVVDVGCGPGALTAELLRRLDPGAVAAVEPSDPFVAAARQRHPDVDIRQAVAEDLPFPDDEFDVALAQLVVHFMDDPVKGIGEMARVTRPGGTVAACVWDHAGGIGPLSQFWNAVHRVDPDAAGRVPAWRAPARGISRSFSARRACATSRTRRSTVSVEHASFEAWWEPFTFGVGPPGVYVAQLDGEQLARLREAHATSFPPTASSPRRRGPRAAARRAVQ